MNTKENDYLGREKPVRLIKIDSSGDERSLKGTGLEMPESEISLKTEEEEKRLEGIEVIITSDKAEPNPQEQNEVVSEVTF